ncbi:NAD(P)-binding protein [Thozetella sp. PMI_491]|nr:NAD(P)-binding protein [Thozetella sp. PMI_491]
MSQKHLRFGNRVAIVTGSGRGLGHEHGFPLGRLDAAVVANSTTPSKAEKPAKDIIEAGGKAIVHVGSVAGRAVADALVKKAVDTFGRIDIVIDNAGFARPVAFEAATNAFLSEMLDVHVRGSFNVTQAAWPYMKRQKYGRVVMITSHWIFGQAQQSIYAVTKPALVAKTISIEGKEHNILVNSVAKAGFTDTITENTNNVQAQELMKKYIPAAEAAPPVLWPAHEDCKITGDTRLPLAFMKGSGACMKMSLTARR